MRKLLIAINGIAIALLVAYAGLDNLYDSQGALGLWGPMILVFALPSIAATAAAMIRTSLAVTGIALVINIVYFLVLLLFTAGAATGIGGAFGLLFVILPVELLLGVNGFGLISGLRSQWANTPLHTGASRQ